MKKLNKEIKDWFKHAGVSVNVETLGKWEDRGYYVVHSRNTSISQDILKVIYKFITKEDTQEFIDRNDLNGYKITMSKKDWFNFLCHS